MLVHHGLLFALAFFSSPYYPIGLSVAVFYWINGILALVRLECSLFFARSGVTLALGGLPMQARIAGGLFFPLLFFSFGRSSFQVFCLFLFPGCAPASRRKGF